MSLNRLARDGRDDARLVKVALRGDAEAFEALVLKHQDLVYNVVYRMVGDREEARDIAQESFVRVYEHLEDLDPGQPFKAYLLRVATNASIDHLRRRARRPDVPALSLVTGRETDGDALLERAAAKESQPENIPEQEALRSDVSVVVRRALMELPENYRAVLVLHHFEDMSYPEISSVLGVPKNTVKTWAHRARGMLADSLGEVV